LDEVIKKNYCHHFWATFIKKKIGPNLKNEI